MLSFALRLVGLGLLSAALSCSTGTSGPVGAESGPVATVASLEPGARPSVLTALREAPVESGRVIHVSAAAGPDGDGSERHPLDSIAEALERAQPGDTVAVGRGTYRTASLKTVRGGRADAPIRIRGRGARIVGEDDGRLVQILHDHVIFQGFDVPGPTSWSGSSMSPAPGSWATT